VADAVFWALIAMLDWGATGNDAAVIAPVVEELSQMSVEEIQLFDDKLASNLFALDTRAHAMAIGEGSYREGEHFSVDGFLYARCAVVANGREVFDAVIAEPGSFPKGLEFESLLYIAAAAYEKKTGENYTYSPTPSYETYSNQKGWR